MYAGREILSRGKILADLEKIKKTRGFFPTRIFPFTVFKKKNFDKVGSNGLGAFGSCPIPDVNFLFIFYLFFFNRPKGRQ